jgi:hypothetical protein
MHKDDVLTIYLALLMLVGLGYFYNNKIIESPFDGGGSVMKYYNEVIDYNKHNKSFAIRGVCASSCTMKLGIKNICIEPDAILMFHQASIGEKRSEYGSKLMLNMYPKKIQKWVIKHKALETNELTSLTGNEAISMGVPACKNV